RSLLSTSWEKPPEKSGRAPYFKKCAAPSVSAVTPIPLQAVSFWESPTALFLRQPRMMGLSMSTFLSRLIATSPLVSSTVPSRPDAPCYVKTASTAAAGVPLTYVMCPAPRPSGTLQTVGFDNGIRTADPSMGSEEPTDYVTFMQLSLDGPQ